MSQTFKCDGCGKLFEKPAEITASTSFPNKTKIYAKMFFFLEDRVEEYDAEDAIDRDYCLNCANSIVKNIFIYEG